MSKYPRRVQNVCNILEPGLTVTERDYRYDALSGDQVIGFHSWWWLRSPGNNDNNAANVNNNGNNVNNDNNAIRPALPEQ